MNREQESSEAAEARIIPSWMSRTLSQGQILALEGLIKDAESKTSGEIVVVLSARSFPLRSIEMLCGVLCATVCIACMEPFLGDWLTYFDFFLLAIGVLTVGVGGYFLAKLSWVRRVLMMDRDSANLANQRAELEFYRAGIARTEKKTGILIFLALHDHEVVVLADRGISDKLSADTWQDVVAMVIHGIKKNDLNLGLQNAIRRCGEILSQHFPVDRDDRNELANHLIIRD